MEALDTIELPTVRAYLPDDGTSFEMPCVYRRGVWATAHPLENGVSGAPSLDRFVIMHVPTSAPIALVNHTCLVLYSSDTAINIIRALSRWPDHQADKALGESMTITDEMCDAIVAVVNAGGG